MHTHDRVWATAPDKRAFSRHPGWQESLAARQRRPMPNALPQARLTLHGWCYTRLPRNSPDQRKPGLFPSHGFRPTIHLSWPIVSMPLVLWRNDYQKVCRHRAQLHFEPHEVLNTQPDPPVSSLCDVREWPPSTWPEWLTCLTLHFLRIESHRLQR